MSSLAPFRYAEQKKEKEKHLEAAGIPLEKAYLIETADVSERRESKAKVKRKNKAAFGWDVFNEDTKAKGYDRRCEALTKRSAPAGGVGASDSSDLAYGQVHKPSEAAMDAMVGELEARAKRASKFSRRRAVNEEQESYSINDRNIVFNKKLNRAFDKYTAEIKGNLERGTALN